MKLRARVGRHAKNGGKNCQNWSDDQKAVVALLNKIPPKDGGAGGALNPRIIAGISSDELFRAILAFEGKHFPGQRSGFIDPDGAMHLRMEALASGAANLAPAPPANPPEPSEVEIMIQIANRKLQGNPNHGAVMRFLKTLKADGYAKVIQNDRIEGYLFGPARWAVDSRPRDLDKVFWDGLKPGVGRSALQPEKLHYATPLYGGNAVQVDRQSAVIVMRQRTWLMHAPYTALIFNSVPYKPPQIQPRTEAERDKLRKGLSKLDKLAPAH